MSTIARIHAVEYLRGLSMLGVVGIHVGSLLLSTPTTNVHLFMLLEIATRFCVPAFFFISAFGLFTAYPLNQPFNYNHFLQHRLKALLLPYLGWSLVYMIHYSLISDDVSIWHTPLVYHYAWFGLASYQLYFMIILSWFYLLLPLWRRFARWLCQAPLQRCGLLVLAQLAFNYYSSYLITANTGIEWLDLLINYRTYYLPLHYLLVFMLGALCAQYYQLVIQKLYHYRLGLILFSSISTAIMISYFYWLVYGCGYSLEQAVNTAHQLSPAGGLYTLGAISYWFYRFHNPLSAVCSRLLSFLGKTAALVYFVHPLVIHYLLQAIAALNLEFTTLIGLVFYSATVLCSLIIYTANQKLKEKWRKHYTTLT